MIDVTYIIGGACGPGLPNRNPDHSVLYHDLQHEEVIANGK